MTKAIQDYFWHSTENHSLGEKKNVITRWMYNGVSSVLAEKPENETFLTENY